MRRKNKVEKNFFIPKWVFLTLAYFLLFILLFLHLINYLFKIYEVYEILPGYNIKIWQDSLIFFGGPITLLLSFILSFTNKKMSGAFLLFGSALISAGIAIQSGYFLKIYLLKMAIVGLPQILCSILFFQIGKK